MFEKTERLEWLLSLFIKSSDYHLTLSHLTRGIKDRQTYQGTDERHDAKRASDGEKTPAERHVRVEELSEPRVDRRHRDEVQRRADSSYTQLKAEDHVQLLALKP